MRQVVVEVKLPRLVCAGDRPSRPSCRWPEPSSTTTALVDLVWQRRGLSSVARPPTLTTPLARTTVATEVAVAEAVVLPLLLERLSRIAGREMNASARLTNLRNTGARFEFADESVRNALGSTIQDGGECGDHAVVTSFVDRQALGIGCLSGVSRCYEP